MLNVCCVKAGTKYGPEYVNILFDMVRRNLTEGTPGRFICFTDDATGLSQGIETRALPEGLNGWWAKLYLFSKEALPEGERALYFDLDVVVTGGLEPLLEYDGDFAALQDKGIPSQINTSIMLWKAGAVSSIWEKWVAEGKPMTATNDQVYIGDSLDHVDILQILYPEKFFSFKLECSHSGPPPKGAMVVYFHGEPRPHQCQIEWVKNTWRIGGGTADDLLMICNTEIEKIKNNIRAACKRNVPWLAPMPPHTGHAVIVGGAPSLKSKIEEVRAMAEAGHTIFATNNTVKFLLDNGITPQYQVIVDAREDNSSFVQQAGPSKAVLLASQCHPATFDKAVALHDVTLWHCLTPELDGTIQNPEKKTECIIACGSTVGLSSMGIAFALGYRLIHIFGMDSSYTDGLHHAYEQPVNDNEIILDAECYGRKFKASAWMLHQANQFQELANILMESDCTIVVHGTGLIPWIALNSGKAMPEPSSEIELKNGVWWPSGDVGTRLDVLTTLSPHTDKLIAACPNHGVAIQAGGNVGLWAKKLSQRFERVITFEPDSLNFECLLRNTEKIPNIERYNVALGDKPSRKGLARTLTNCGAHYIVDGDEFNVITIDSLSLAGCDLIQLDIEGYELHALKGAEQTINKFKPVICLELKSTGLRHGITDLDTVHWLQDHGYGEALRMGRDVVFAPNIKEDQRCISKAHTLESIQAY